MTITYDSTANRSYIKWNDDYLDCATPRIIPAQKIVIGKDSPYWQMAFCHEIGHALLMYAEVDSMSRFTSDTWSYCVSTMLVELLAWRLAKTFCRNDLWNDDYAVDCLNQYADVFQLPDCVFTAQNIIEINAGILV